jgi:hypothetical protein
VDRKFGESFLFVFHHRDVLSTRQFEEVGNVCVCVCVCVIYVRRDVNAEQLFVQKELSVQHGSQLQELYGKACDV